MKKRVLSILTALCLCLTLLPVAAFATEESSAAPAEEPQQEQQEEVNPEANPEQPEGQPEVNPAEQPAAENSVPVALSGEGETVIKLTPSNISNYMSSGLTDGSYQLGGDVTIESGSLEVKGTVTLDLNGHTLLFKDPELYYPPIQGQVNAGIRVYNSDSSESAAKYALTLCDTSTAKTGTLDVWGESMAESGEGLFVGQNGELTMTGGTITDSSGTNPWGIGIGIIEGEVTMTGGKIENQTRCGVTLAGGTFEMSGDAVISNCGGNNSGGGIWIGGGTFTMSGGTIKNCNATQGGGVYVGAGTFIMTGGSIVDCTASTTNYTMAMGGGVYVANRGTFNMSGGSIENCKAMTTDSTTMAFGGGIRNDGRTTLSGTAKIRNCQAANAGGGIYDYSILNISDNVEITGCTAPLWSAMIVSGTISGGTFNGTVTSGGTITGGTFNGEVRNVGTITGGTFNSQVTNLGRITGGTFKGGITGTPALATGSGTEDDPYQIGTAIGLEWFRDKVNDASSIDETKICAELTADITLDSSEAWKPIGNSTNNGGTDAYSGTFDGKGHTISGLNVTGEFVYAGLFGTVKDGTIKSLTVAGKVSPSNSQCIVGGIVGYASNAVIKNCSNHCSVTGRTTSIIGGIAGFNSSGAIIDCYNVGTISGINYAEAIGGIVGSNSGTISNCYNVGTVSNDTSVGEIAGHNSDTVENCYYLNTTNNNAVGKNKGTITSTKSMTAAQFADGTVLNLLINGRADSEHPWNSQCQYLAAAGKTLPVFKTQTGDAHTHDWSAWTHMEGTETHRRSCTTCNAVETVRCSGGTATCTERAVCDVCKAEYGAIAPDNHGGKLKHEEAKAATTREEGNIEYWHCEACNKYFSDANGAHEITQAETVIPKWHFSGSTSSYPITVPDRTENGSVTVSPKNASKGSTVTITVTPDSGYALETITVTDKNGNELKLTDKGNGKYTFTMPGSKVEVKVTFMEDNSVLNFFYDVPNDAYYYEAVKWAVENGITGGIGNSLFAPNQPCTRAQIVTFLWRAAGSPVVNYLMPFTDVDEGAYYAKAVRWAASTGIVTGLTETTFGANGVCTRAQVVTMLYRFAKAQGMDTTQGGMAIREFDDFDTVPAYALEAMDWAVNAGVLKGDNNRLLPQNACTRAQIVTLLWRAFGR